MTDATVHEHTFTGVEVLDRDRVFVTAVSDELEESGEDHALLFRWRNDEWVHWPITTAVGGTCAVINEQKFLAMGIDGEITVIKAPPYEYEHVDRSADGPSDLVHLKAIRLIGDHVYVAGMARRVYRRDGPDSWLAIDDGVFVPRERRDRSVGFLDLDGNAENAIYAVGMKGEIWFFDGSTWEQQDSPTNSALACVAVLADDNVVAAGLGGTVLRGSRGRWQALEQDATDGDFWDITVFQNRVYLASDAGLFVLDQDSLQRVDLGLGEDFTTMYVHAKDGVMWSAGQKHLASTSDGQQWTHVASPG
jgi:hypothetical protein